VTQRALGGPRASYRESIIACASNILHLGYVATLLLLRSLYQYIAEEWEQYGMAVSASISMPKASLTSALSFGMI
jgi:hypothetical protein